MLTGTNPSSPFYFHEEYNEKYMKGKCVDVDNNIYTCMIVSYNGNGKDLAPKDMGVLIISLVLMGFFVYCSGKKGWFRLWD